ncbi:Kelch repeat-containing protein, partial [Gemmatimonadota bacterium]
YQPTGVQAGDVTIGYVISDVEGSPVGLLAEYSTDSGSTWQAASITGDTSAIATADYDSSLVWQSATDLANQNQDNIWFKVTPHDAGGWGTADITYLAIDNLAPQWVAAEGVAGDSILTFWFNEPVADTLASDPSNYSLSGSYSISNISPTDQWRTLAAMPTTRMAPASGVINGKLYIAGGEPAAGALQAYDPVTDSWEVLTSLPTTTDRGRAFGVIDGKLYVAGGEVNSNSSARNLEVYDPHTDVWSSGADMPTGRNSAIAGVIDGKLYVVGGWVLSPQNVLEVYDPASDTWETRQPMPTARSQMHVGVIDGKLYVAGGFTGNTTYTDVLEVYDPASDSWTQLAPMQVARRGGAFATWGNRLFIFGGNDAGGYLSSTEVYDAESDSWSFATSIPTARRDTGFGLIDGLIYIAGGFDGDYLNVLEVYDPQESFEAELDTGQTLAVGSFTITASNMQDLLGNIAAELDTTYNIPDSNRPAISIYQPNGTQTGDITIPYVITDPDDSAVGLLAEYSTNQGDSWAVAAIGSDTSGIAAADYASNLVWQSGTDLADQELSSVWFRIMPRDAGGWGTADTTYIEIDNQAPQWIDASGTAGIDTLTFWFDQPVNETVVTTTSNISLSGELTVSSITPIEQWTGMTTRPSIYREDNGAGTLSGKLYVVGGREPGHSIWLDSAEVYDPETGNWSTIAPMPTARENPIVVELDGRLCVAGGYASGVYVQVIEFYDPVTGTWETESAPISWSAFSASGAVIDGKLYVNDDNGDIDIYDAATHTWKSTTGGLANRSTRSVAYQGKL